MSGGALDLGAYFARIGYDGPAEPTLATLRALHELHPRAIPFENLSPFVGETPALDPQSLQAKLVRGGRGGWCFEQNLLFSHALSAIGFSFRRLAARVRWNVAPDVVTARSHCLLQVAIEGRDYLADVGFGGLVLTGPIAMEIGREQATPHEDHRLREEGSAHRVEAKVGGEWQALYDFELTEAKLPDYEVSNWYLANFPQSHFVTSLVAARAEEGIRHALRGNRYSVHRADGTTERHFATSAAELFEWLEGPFRIQVPRSERLEEKLARLVELGQEAQRGQTPMS